MNVGQDVPVLTSSGVAVTGSSYNSVSNRSTGTTLSILARVNSSGVVTIECGPGRQRSPDQHVEQHQLALVFTALVLDQVTVQDGETIAIGGFIQETKAHETSGIPVLSRDYPFWAAYSARSATARRARS